MKPLVLVYISLTLALALGWGCTSNYPINKPPPKACGLLFQDDAIDKICELWKKDSLGEYGARSMYVEEAFIKSFAGNSTKCLEYFLGPPNTKTVFKPFLGKTRGDYTYWISSFASDRSERHDINVEGSVIFFFIAGQVVLVQTVSH